MEYPNSKLNKKIRLAILIVFLALFFIATPIIILRVSGFRYDWQRGLLRETGAINIDIQPSVADVYVNGIKIKSKMPVRMVDLIPGKYTIRISAPEFYDWQKEVEVKNRQTIYIKDISMLKKREPQSIAEGVVDQLKISRDGRYLVYSKTNGKMIEGRIFDNRSGSDLLLASLPAEQGMKIELAPQNYYFSLSQAEPPYQNILIFNAAEPEKKINLAEKTKEKIVKYQWKETSQPEIYYGTTQRIFSFTPETEQQYFLGRNTFLDWYMENGQMWALEKTTSTEKIRLLRDALGFANEFAGENKFETKEQKLKIAAAKNNVVLLKKTEQAEMIILYADEKFSLAGEKFKISEFNDWWLIWTPWEIWTYLKGEEPNLLNRSGEQLEEVLPLDKYNTLALVWAEKTTALFPYYLVTHDLLNIPSQTAAADPNNRIMYFSGSIGNRQGLWKMEY